MIIFKYYNMEYLGEIFNTYILDDNYQLCERLLINFKIDIDNLIYKGNTLLMMASSVGSLDLVLLFLEYGANVNIKNGFKLTALLHATINNHINVMNELINHGADVNASNFYGINSLMIATKNGYYEGVYLLLQKHQLLLNERDKIYENTALHYAIIYKNIHIVDLLLHYGAQDNIRNKEGKTIKDYRMNFIDLTKIYK